MFWLSSYFPVYFLVLIAPGHKLYTCTPTKETSLLIFCRTTDIFQIARKLLFLKTLQLSIVFTQMPKISKMPYIIER